MRETLSLVQLGMDDVNDLVSLSQSVQWDYTAEEVQNFIAAGKVFGHRTLDGHLISSAGVFQYGYELASIGIVIVHPDFQGRGLGKAVVKRCLEEVDQIPTMLVSTVEGLKLYKSLGFKVHEYVHKLVSNVPVSIPTGRSDLEIYPLTPRDHEDVIQLDRTVMGADRTRFLLKRFEFTHSGVVLRDRNRTLNGFGFAIRRHRLLIVGPIVAPDESSAVAIVNQLTAGWTGPVRIDVPDRQKNFYSSLLRAGMVEEDTPPIMLLNSSQLLGRREQLYAIAAQAFG